MLALLTLLLFAERFPLTAQLRSITEVPGRPLECLTDPKIRIIPPTGNFRLYVNKLPTAYFMPKSDMKPRVATLQRKEMRDGYVHSTFSSNGAIMAWTQIYLFWNDHSLFRVPINDVDPLEIHPDGRLVVIEQFDSWSAVGINETGWEQDRKAYLVLGGRVNSLGEAVNLWFEKDGSIRGISNGRNKSGTPSEKASPHYFSYRNGVRTDEPVQAGMLKRTGKRLYPLKGNASRY